MKLTGGEDVDVRFEITFFYYPTWVMELRLGDVSNVIVWDVVCYW